jgi:membrane associated rhomboid family serine protease
MPNTEEEVRRWGLVLASQGIDCQVERDAVGWTLVVAPADAERAAAVLAAYQAENRPTAPAAVPDTTGAVGRRSFAGGAALAGLLAAFFLVTGPPDPANAWFAAGEASAERILGGEWWRAVTALTLHAGWAHVAANGFAALLFVSLVFAAVGLGVGAWLILLAGALGNGLNALLYGSHHTSVGASTAMFGAIGILGALEYTRQRRSGARGLRAWAPLGAGLALLALLGASIASDVLAHFFGFAAGVALGLAVGHRLATPPRPLAQTLLLFGAIAAVLACWALALGLGPPL